MKIADLTERKGARVDVRVPAALREQLGDRVQGTVIGLRKRSASTKVLVKVPRKGEYEFRPQDLTLA